MNFSAQTKAWVMLVSLVLSSGIGVGYAAFLSGAGPFGSFVCGLGTAATNVYHALSSSPKDKADAVKDI